jgi:conjugal transfer pilus assembly protein TraB
MKEKLIRWLRELEPRKKRNLYIVSAIAALLLISYALIAIFQKPKSAAAAPKRKLEYTSLYGGKSPREVSLEAIAGRVKKMTDDFSSLKLSQSQEQKLFRDKIEKLDAHLVEEVKRSQELERKLRELEQKLDEARSSSQVPLPPLPERPGAGPRYGREGAPGVPPARDPGAPPVPMAADGTTGIKIRIVTQKGEIVQKPQTQAKDAPAGKNGEPSGRGRIQEAHGMNVKQDPVLPSGSILSGTLITGLDAPTANQSRNDPFPSLLRVKHEAILPNRFRMDIRECFLIAGGYGDLSSERAYMRAESLSCVKRDGGVIDVSLDAYAVGEDGKAGVRGRLVSKNGQLLANSLLSGFVSGISRAFAPQRVPTFFNYGRGTNPGQIPYQYPSPSMLMGQGIGGGIRGAAEQIADYYLEMAKNIFPVIEVDAGRKVDFVVIRGASLRASGSGRAAAFGGGAPRRQTYASAGAAGAVQSLFPYTDPAAGSRGRPAAGAYGGFFNERNP